MAEPQSPAAGPPLKRGAYSSLAKAASRVIVAKGKSVTEFKTAAGAPKDCVDAMLGPTGNLRAPTYRVGDRYLIGFNADLYADWVK